MATSTPPDIDALLESVAAEAAPKTQCHLCIAAIHDAGVNEFLRRGRVERGISFPALTRAVSTHWLGAPIARSSVLRHVRECLNVPD